MRDHPDSDQKDLSRWARFMKQGSDYYGVNANDFEIRSVRFARRTRRDGYLQKIWDEMTGVNIQDLPSKMNLCGHAWTQGQGSDYITATGGLERSRICDESSFMTESCSERRGRRWWVLGASRARVRNHRLMTGTHLSMVWKKLLRNIWGELRLGSDYQGNYPC